jgi:hypothetical protein
VWHHDRRTDAPIIERYREYGCGQGALYAKHLRRGDLRVTPWLACDIARAAAPRFGVGRISYL